ncbi:MAG TPA: sigma 54-interacting transcriptional regulator, partial [Polyangiaceae bacterium]
METLSGDDTRSRRGAAENHLVHWVFPEPATTLLESSTVVLGRGEQCTPPLAGQRVSRRHAEIRRSGPLAILIDLGSTNGVFVNGERAERAVLKVGDVVRLGDCVGVVSEASGVTAQPQTFGEIAPGLYGGSCLRAAYGPLEKAGQLSVVLEGETGTGKEVFAKAAHRVSGRDPFVAVNCAALPESLAEAELFGYRQGAFTGASRSQPGYLRAASGGTLLLDEIVELPMAIQTKLLRAVEMGEVSPLGEHKPVRIDVRWIAAAQQPLGAAVEKGRFRADLLARLDGLTLRIPPLRERKEDILPLFLHFLGSENPRFQPSVSARFVEALCLHDWPLNVRELLQLAKRLVVFCADEPRLQRSHLPQSMLVKTEAAPSGARHSEEIVIDQGRRARRRQA